MSQTVKEHCKHKDCKFRITIDSQPACGYMMYTGKPREKEISECDKYQNGRIRFRSYMGGFGYEDDDI